MSDHLWPCQRDPELWFSENRKELGRAVHFCLSHCRRLAECHATEARPRGGVLAGVRYVVNDSTNRPEPERRRLHEVACAACGPDPKPQPMKEPTDTAACGTAKGFHRHVARGEQPCDPCAQAKLEYQRDRYRSWLRRRRALVS